MPIKRNKTKMPLKKKTKAKKPNKKKKSKLEDKSTSTNGIIDHFIFHLWEGKVHHKTIQGIIPEDILKINSQLEVTVNNLLLSCQYSLPKLYLMFSLIVLLSVSIFSCFEKNWYLLNGSAITFFISNVWFFNSFRINVKKFKNLLKAKIKNLSQTGLLGRFVVDWRIDYKTRKSRVGELGSLINEIRVELQIIKREIRREESLFAPSASKLLNLDDNNFESDEMSERLIGDFEEEKVEEGVKNIEVLEISGGERKNCNKPTKRTQRKMYGEDEGEDAGDDAMDFDNLSLPNDEAWALSHEPEIVSVRINGQDLVCFPQRYHIRRPHHPDFNTYKITGSDGGEEEDEEIFQGNS